MQAHFKEGTFWIYKLALEIGIMTILFPRREAVDKVFKD
jgi:hypothetical protein